MPAREIARRLINGVWRTGVVDEDAAAFNGGTITAPLVVSLSDSATVLSILGAADQASDLPRARRNDEVGSRFTVDQNGSVAIYPRSNDATPLYISTGAAPTLPIMSVWRDDTDLLYSLGKGGHIITAVHAAPADASIEAGECALWFDQTNGAAKLMVKAKTLDGTVVTGQLALT